MRSLRDAWGVTNAEEWLKAIGSLLGDESDDPRVSLVLRLRDEEAGGAAPGSWEKSIGRWCRDGEVSPETERVLRDLAVRISRYEERFRADGLLPPGGIVRGTHAYDLGRAVNMARWGLEAQFCDQVTAERLIIEAGERCRWHYGSWAELSAGYALGRVLRLGERESAGYDSVLAAHRVLTEAPDGPWQTVTWEPGR
jgi:hypothetical protein